MNIFLVCEIFRVVGVGAFHQSLELSTAGFGHATVDEFVFVVHQEPAVATPASLGVRE